MRCGRLLVLFALSLLLARPAAAAVDLQLVAAGLPYLAFRTPATTVIVSFSSASMAESWYSTG
jgi:hypothetical protein